VDARAGHEGCQSDAYGAAVALQDVAVARVHPVRLHSGRRPTLRSLRLPAQASERADRLRRRRSRAGRSTPVAAKKSAYFL
jgi:hypothetical protein